MTRFPNFCLSHLTQTRPRAQHFPLQILHHGGENLRPQLVGQVGQAALLPRLSPQTRWQVGIRLTNHQGHRGFEAAELVAKEYPIQCWGNQEEKSSFH